MSRLLLPLVLLALPAAAQHQPAGHQPPAGNPTPPAHQHMPGMAMPSPADTAHPGRQHTPGMDMSAPADSSHAARPHMGMNHMSHAYSRHLPMARNGSGTAWNPDQTPLYMWMQHRGPWMLMYHGSAFGRYTSQNFNHPDGRGSARRFDGPNWLMTMAQRTIGQRGLLNLSLMVSLDPLTETPGGYPLLFQTGESYKGRPLIDKQHPHDLLSGLSVGYTHAFGDDVDVTAYLGYPGEPAIGPVAFMHRISAMPNPDAPLSHHWTDATHITFGVATLGVRYRQFRIEGSNFTGREPDEHRYGLDRVRADSWAGRLSWNPTSTLALQVSRAFIKSPEDLHPADNVTRTTASVIHNRSRGERRFIASTLVWGLNQGHGPHAEHAVLAESNLTLGRPTVYGRYEWVQKGEDELGVVLPDGTGAAVHPIFNIHALTLGASVRLTPATTRAPELHLGGQLTGYLPDQRLEYLYGRLPLSASVYVRVNAPWMRPMP